VPENKTPEERLRDYKKELARMAEAEGRSLKSTQEREAIPDDEEIEQTPAQGPPRVLESPAKRELREASPPNGERTAKRGTRSSGFAKDRMLLMARERAINSSLRDLKERKERLELVYKRKLIGRDEFERRKQELTEEGQKLLQEKAEVDRQLAR
jgi:hypothetical protein